MYMPLDLGRGLRRIQLGILISVLAYWRSLPRLENINRLGSVSAC